MHILIQVINYVCSLAECDLPVSSEQRQKDDTPRKFAEQQMKDIQQKRSFAKRLWKGMKHMLSRWKPYVLNLEYVMHSWSAFLYTNLLSSTYCQHCKILTISWLIWNASKKNILNIKLLMKMWPRLGHICSGNITCRNKLQCTIFWFTSLPCLSYSLES